MWIDRMVLNRETITNWNEMTSDDESNSQRLTGHKTLTFKQVNIHE